MSNEILLNCTAGWAGWLSGCLVTPAYLLSLPQLCHVSPNRPRHTTSVPRRLDICHADTVVLTQLLAPDLDGLGLLEDV